MIGLCFPVNWHLKSASLRPYERKVVVKNFYLTSWGLVSSTRSAKLHRCNFQLGRPRRAAKLWQKPCQDLRSFAPLSFDRRSPICSR